MLFPDERQRLLEFGKTKTLDIKFYSIVCFGVDIFLNSPEAEASVSQFVDTVA